MFGIIRNQVNLVVEVNMASTAGVVRVMEHLHTYVPQPDGQVQVILYSGDGLSVEKMVQAKKARANGERKKDQLQGLIECPQEFHKEMLSLQVSQQNH